MEQSRYVDVHFRNELHDLHVNAEYVTSVEIKDGFLQIFDSYDNYLHCYNINNVEHYHVPGEV